MLEYIKTIVNKFSEDNSIPNPPYSYDFLFNLKEEDYPKYLKKIFKASIGENLNLKNPKTLNEKIQWLKLYDATPLKTRLTDKVLVRDWVKEQIGEEYLKPVLWIGENFDEIPFDILPNEFIIKTNHGCKWHYIVKEKHKLLSDKRLYNFIKLKFDGWMHQTFFPFGGLELQYKNIKPKIIIEKLLFEESSPYPIEYEIYCFNGIPKIFQKIQYAMPASSCVYDEQFNVSNIRLNPAYSSINEPVDENLKKAVKLSEKLAVNFKLVRVDWLKYYNKIYFNEMTFTPYSGFFVFQDQKWNKQLGKMLNIKD